MGELEYYILPLAVVLVFAYFLGCFNGAVIVSKYILKDDVRNHGSGNAGLTNFYRTFGGPLTFVVILTDFLKGIFSILLANLAAEQLGALDLVMYFRYLGAIGCLSGHMFPVTFKFKGGKGVLSGGAIILMMDPRIAVIAWVGFFAIVIFTRYVSLGSCYAGVAFIVANAVFFPDPVSVAMGTFLGGLVLWGHRENIKRLLKGEENRFSFRKKEKKQDV